MTPRGDKERVRALAVAAGCRPTWHDGILGWAWHCGCADLAHAADQQCSAITEASLRRGKGKAPYAGAPEDPPTFEAAWAKKVAEGYLYGRDALEQVRFGWEIRAAADRDARKRAFDEVLAELESLRPLLTSSPSAARTYLELRAAIAAMSRRSP